jgi:hypothetical protein
MHSVEGDVKFATIGRDEVRVGRWQWKDRGYGNGAGEEGSHAMT